MELTAGPPAGLAGLAGVARRTVAVAPAGTLALVLHVPEAHRPVPCVVACHGLNAGKDGEKYLLLGEAFPAAGLALARFDFRGCGESTGVEDDTDVATRLDDIDAVLHALAREPALDGRFGLLGSSMGGYAALHMAARRADIGAVVTWNVPVRLRGLGVADGTAGLRALRAEARAGRHAEAPAAVRRHLVVQAGADEVVPPEHGRELHARAAEPRELAVIPGADHRIGDPVARQEAVRLSVAWLARFLTGPAAA